MMLRDRASTRYPRPAPGRAARQPSTHHPPPIARSVSEIAAAPRHRSPVGPMTQTKRSTSSRVSPYRSIRPGAWFGATCTRLAGARSTARRADRVQKPHVPSKTSCVFRRKGPGVSVQTDHPVRAKRTGPEDGDATPIQLSEVVLARRRSCQELLSNPVVGVVGSVGNPVGLSKAGGQAGRIAGSAAAPGGRRGCDLPGLSTGRHFPQPFVVPRGDSERQRRRAGAQRGRNAVHHGVGLVVPSGFDVRSSWRSRWRRR